MQSPPHPKAGGIWTSLYLQIVAAIAAGVLLGYFVPSAGTSLKPVSDAFIKVLRLILPPIVFTTVAIGIGGAGSLRQIGRIGLKALVYFEVVTTAAFALGLLVVHLAKPGAGLNIDPRQLDAGAVSGYVQSARHLGAVEYLLNIIPSGLAAPFVDNDILQVLFLAVPFGLALAHAGQSCAGLLRGLRQFNEALFTVIAYLMRVAPVAVFGAIAFTVGQYGLATLRSLAALVLCFAAASAVFVLGVLGAVCLASGVNLWKLLRYIRAEMLLTLGTSTSEPALPLVMQKLERLGCSKTIVGFVLPAGYAFNLDGASLYLTLAFVFIAQATNTPLTWGQELYALAIMLLTSKGSAGIPGGGFVALAATLSAVHLVPIGGLALLLGVDRFISALRAWVNVVGNTVATVVISRWEGEFDAATAERVLNGGADAVRA